MPHRAQQPSTASSSYDYYASPSQAPPHHSTADYSTYSYEHDGGGYDAYDHGFGSPDLGGGGGEQDDPSGPSYRTTGTAGLGLDSHPKPPRRNDSIFSITSPAFSRVQGGHDEDGGGGAFQGEEYQADPFSTTTTERSRRNKRYGLSDSDTYDTTGRYSGESSDDDDDDESDLEVYNAHDAVERPLSTLTSAGQSATTTATAKLGRGAATGASRRHARFEALTMHELGWMGISALCVVGLTTGAVVVAVIG